MRIVFLNVWRGEVGEAIFEFINKEKQNTDIFVFMESSDDFKLKCKKILFDYLKVDASKKSDNEDEYLLATYIKNDCKILDSKIILEDDFNIGYGLYSKIFFNNQIINLMNVHGAPRPGDKLDNPKRIEQSKEIINFMEKTEGLKIVGGDFNLEPETESVKMFEKNGYRNLIKEYKITTTRNDLAWSKYESKQMFADYVFVSPEVKVKSFEVPNIEVSDHLPLILEI